MKKSILFLLLVLSVAGCTQQLQQYTVSGVYQSVETDYDLDVLVTDEFQIRRSNLFSGEQTRLTLNLINLAEVDFSNVQAILINADDLSPETEVNSYEQIEANHSEQFEWDLTAPSLGLGETLLLNNIKVRVFYDAYAQTTKSIRLKESGDRIYTSSIVDDSTESPVAIYFDTSYETVTTLNEGYKNFTANLIFFNNYSGVIDYYDETSVADNYVKRVMIGADKSLMFYNFMDKDSPWKKVNDSWTDAELQEYNLERNDLLLNDYYYVEYQTIESQGYSLCEIQEYQVDEDYNDLQNSLTEQRRVLWMTRGFTKVNVLRFGAPPVTGDTDVNLFARVDYGYSQDYGGEGFGAVVYGLG